MEDRFGLATVLGCAFPRVIVPGSFHSTGFAVGLLIQDVITDQELNTAFLAEEQLFDLLRRRN